MPIPGMDELSVMFYSRAEWETHFSLWPRRCELSNKLLWLKQAVKGTAVWHGPGEPAVECRWHDAKEHLVWKLKGN